MNLARLDALSARVDHLRGSLGVEPVRMADGTTREVNVVRVFTDTLAAVRAGETTPWLDFLAGVDTDALNAEGGTGERLFLLAVVRYSALDDEGNPRVIPDLSDDPAALANENAFDADPTEGYDIPDEPPTAPRREDYPDGDEFGRAMGAWLDHAPLNALTPKQRRYRLSGGLKSG